MSAPPAALPLVLLASTSPRRRDLLAAAGVEFVCVPPGDEVAGGGAPRELARARATAKALGAEVARAGRAGVVVGVDTVVDLDGTELGKPAGATAARACLSQLAGRVHRVHTACACLPFDPRSGLRRAALQTFVDTATVEFRALSPAEIDAFVAGGSWRGKAGGYGIQDDAGRFARCVGGDPDTVVGLPVARLLGALRALAGQRGRG